METQHPGGLDAIQQLEDHSRYQRKSIVEDTTTQNPVFTQPMHNLVKMENQRAHFECRLIPVNDPKLKSEWFFNGRPLEAGNESFQASSIIRYFKWEHLYLHFTS